MKPRWRHSLAEESCTCHVLRPEQCGASSLGRHLLPSVLWRSGCAPPLRMSELWPPGKVRASVAKERKLAVKSGCHQESAKCLIRDLTGGFCCGDRFVVLQGLPGSELSALAQESRMFSQVLGRELDSSK